jgi:hypothetical protein
MNSNKRLLANQQNALRSTGPRTAAGKARAALNATKHGAYSKALLIDGENPQDLNLLYLDLLAQYHPANVIERCLVDQIATTLWRLRRFLIAEAQLLESYRHYRFDQEVEPGDLGTALAHDRSHVQAIPGNLACEEILHKRLLRTIQELERRQAQRQARESAGRFGHRRPELEDRGACSNAAVNWENVRS